MANTLMDTLDATEYLCVIWQPTQSAPVNVFSMKIGGIALTPLNPDDPDSPRAFRVPPAMRGTRQSIAWVVAPTIDVERLGVALTTPGFGPPRMVKDTDDPKNCARGSVWQDGVDGFPV